MTRHRYAHTKPGRPPQEWQTIEDHLANVADLARRFGQRIGIGDWSELAGRWHDIGKYSDEFQRRIGAAEEACAESQSNSVDHSTAGAQHAHQAMQDLGLPLSYVIAGHHAGLANWLDESGSNLRFRLGREVPDWSATPDHVKAPLSLSVANLPFNPDRNTLGVQLFVFIKMLFSTLVDADFLDTESFMQPAKAIYRASPWTTEAMKTRLDRALKELTQRAKEDPSANHVVNQARASVLQACRDAASLKPGLFTLTVPTGGSKTLSSLAFGVDHALRWDLDRIIYVIPYTSIIEQNAAVFRAVLGEIHNESPVLEHHSNYESESEMEWNRLASENWDAPLVVTTNVQFFESIFAHKVGRNRRLHNIAGSIIILDEAQMLPPDLLAPTLRVIDELATTYRCTFVFCTATQPAVTRRPEFPHGLANVREIVPDVPKLFNTLKRTRIVQIGTVSNAVLAGHFADHPQAMVVVNTRNHARSLFQSLKEAGLDHLFHLSALMYPEHRRGVLRTVRERLANGLPCRLVSTQLIEAGVDIDFPVVFRAMAGLDSIAQAAGRCNREGRAEEPAPVYLFTPAESGIPRQFRQAVAATADALTAHQDLLAPEAIKAFFQGYYWRQQRSGGQDRTGILAKLDSQAAAAFRIPFRDISESYRIIDSVMTPIVVKREPTHPDTAEIEKILKDSRWADSVRGMVRKLQAYTVQVYDHAFRRFHAEGALDEVRPGVHVLNNPRAYSEQFGLVDEDPGIRAPETMFL